MWPRVFEIRVRGVNDASGDVFWRVRNAPREIADWRSEFISTWGISVVEKVLWEPSIGVQ